MNGLGLDALENHLLSEMGDAMVCWAWMPWESYALDRKRTLLWFGHGCSVNPMLSNMNDIVVWAWVLWESFALGKGRSEGLS